MVQEAPGPINFTMFLTIFGDRVQGMLFSVNLFTLSKNIYPTLNQGLMKKMSF